MLEKNASFGESRSLFTAVLHMGRVMNEKRVTGSRGGLRRSLACEGSLPESA